MRQEGNREARLSYCPEGIHEVGLLERAHRLGSTGPKEPPRIHLPVAPPVIGASAPAAPHARSSVGPPSRRGGSSDGRSEAERYRRPGFSERRGGNIPRRSRRSTAGYVRALDPHAELVRFLARRRRPVDPDDSLGEFRRSVPARKAPTEHGRPKLNSWPGRWVSRPAPPSLARPVAGRSRPRPRPAAAPFLPPSAPDDRYRVPSGPPAGATPRPIDASARVIGDAARGAPTGTSFAARSGGWVHRNGGRAALSARSASTADPAGAAGFGRGCATGAMSAARHERVGAAGPGGS